MAKNKRKRRPKNTQDARRNAKTDEPLLSNNNFVLDFSFEGLYYSVKNKDFSNYLATKDEFIYHFRDIRKLNSKISHNYKFDDVRNNNAFHCHTFDKNKNNLIIKQSKKHI